MTELIDRLRERFKRYPHFSIDELSLDRCVMTLRFLPEWETGAGNIHGGVLASLADTAVACALATNFGGKMGFATSNLNIHFLRRARTDVVAVATIIKKGSKVCVGQVDMRDLSDQLVATCTCDFVLTTSKMEGAGD
jgi:uncharacterized protein (TIGR00369 family)